MYLYIVKLTDICCLRRIGYISAAICAVCLLLGGCKSAKRGVVSENPGQIECPVKHTKGHFTPDLTKVVEEAKTWIGTPYAYGRAEKGSGTDCSGMVLRVYEKVTGCKIPRNSAKQADFCIPLSKKDVVPGDLVFFATGKDPAKVSHVGIMLDDVSFIHASTKGVLISRIDSPYYIRTFMGYGRVPEKSSP